MENLKEKTTKGLFWSMMNSGTIQLLNVVIGILLGRLLSPADFGIVGVLTIFTVIVHFLFQGQHFEWNHLAAFACLVLAVFFAFLK